MLSVAIHKDIAEYQPKVIGKLTGRTLISITVALGLSIAVAVYMNLVLKIDPTDHLEFIYAVSLPCWCCGFWKPHGLPFEQFALLWLQPQLSDNRLFYKALLLVPKQRMQSTLVLSAPPLQLPKTWSSAALNSVMSTRCIKLANRL